MGSTKGYPAMTQYSVHVYEFGGSSCFSSRISSHDWLILDFPSTDRAICHPSAPAGTPIPVVVIGPVKNDTGAMRLFSLDDQDPPVTSSYLTRNVGDP